MSDFLKLTEFPNFDVVEKLARHKSVHPEQRDLYYAYARAIKDGKVHMNYKPRRIDDEPLGRLYSTTPYMMSSTSMWNRCRATLFKDTEYDVDIVNCHFRLLLGMCRNYEKSQIIEECDYQILQHYCENREEVFENFYINEDAIERFNEEYDENKTKKDMLKTLFTIVLYGGSVKTWEKTYCLSMEDYDLSTEFYGIECEVNFLAKTIVKNHPKANMAREMYLRKVKKKSRVGCYDDKKEGDEKIKEPKPQKLLAYILQNLEREIVVGAIKYLQRKNFTVTCYSYDGFQIKKDERIHDELQNINDEEKCVEFIIKPFRDPLPLEDKHLEPPVLDKFDALEMWRIGLVKQFDEETQKYVIQPTTQSSMKKKQAYFEKYFFWIRSQKKLCEIMSDGNYNYIGTTHFDMYFNNVKYVNEKGDHCHFIKWWSKQLDRLTYEKQECLPPPCHCPENVYNLWKGYEIAEEPYDETADFSILLEHFWNVSGRDDDAKEYLLNWFAWKVQKPGKKLEVALVLYSEEEGTGKSCLAEQIMKMFLGSYQAQFFRILKGIKDIVGRFNNVGEAFVAVLNEASGQDSFGCVDKIKDFITQQTFNKEMKGLTIENGQRSLCDMIYTSNNDNCVKIPPTDRRFAIFEAYDGVVKNYDYFKKLWNALEDKRVMRAFYQYLMDRDLNDFIPQRDRPRTEVYQTFAVNSLSPIQHFWIEKYREYTNDKLRMFQQEWNPDANAGATMYAIPISDAYNAFDRYFTNDFKKAHSYSKNKFSRASRKVDGVMAKTMNYQIERNGEKSVEKCILIHWEGMVDLVKQAEND